MKKAKHVVKLNGKRFGREPEYIWLTDKVEILVWQGDKLHVVASICPHMGGQLRLRKSTMDYHCPWHGLTFSHEDFRSQHHKFKRIRAYEAEVVGDELRVYG